MKERKAVLIRVAIITATLLLAWLLFFRSGPTWQYEVVQEGVLYRASARTEGEFVAATLKISLQGMVVAGTTEQVLDDAGVLVTAQNYGHKNRARVTSIRVEQKETPTREDAKRFIDYVGLPQRRPVLLVDTDGRLAGMLTAAYRLEVLKMPLKEVQERAALKDAPPEIVEKVQRYAQQYAQDLDRLNAPEQPLGPAVSE